jgi:hypothetical protein
LLGRPVVIGMYAITPVTSTVGSVGTMSVRCTANKDIAVVVHFARIAAVIELLECVVE